METIRKKKKNIINDFSPFCSKKKKKTTSAEKNIITLLFIPSNWRAHDNERSYMVNATVEVNVLFVGRVDPLPLRSRRCETITERNVLYVKITSRKVKCVLMRLRIHKFVESSKPLEVLVCSYVCVCVCVYGCCCVDFHGQGNSHFGCMHAHICRIEGDSDHGIRLCCPPNVHYTSVVVVACHNQPIKKSSNSNVIYCYRIMDKLWNNRNRNWPTYNKKLSHWQLTFQKLSSRPERDRESEKRGTTAWIDVHRSVRAWK